jgi:hypothetical protein
MQKDVPTLASCDTPGKQTEEQFFENYQKRFFSAVKWNTFESIGYQFIFVLHQMGLFLYCDRLLYGKVGALFSACYVSVTLVVAGFDGGLLPFFKRFISDKRSFKIFLFNYVSRQIFGMAIVTYVLWFVIIHIRPFFELSATTIFLLATFIVVEGMKKILKHLLYLVFYNRQTALYEVVQMVFYVATVWGCYWSGIPFSVQLFFVPFILYSIIFSFLCMRKLLHYYRTLVVDSGINVLPSGRAFFTIRASVLINQVSRAFFSSNFLIPLFALHGGFQEAGVLTFANYLTHACVSFFQKIALSPAEALFSRIKQFSLVFHYRALTLVFYLFSILATIVGLFVFLKGQACAESLGCGSLHHLTWTVIIFFFLIHLLESMFILYEKFFLMQEKVKLLALGNALTCFMCYVLFLKGLPFFTLVSASVFIRFTFFIFLSFLIYRLKDASIARIEQRK